MSSIDISNLGWPGDLFKDNKTLSCTARHFYNLLSKQDAGSYSCSFCMDTCTFKSHPS